MAEPQRVLVVDDNLEAAETLADLLQLWGHEVCVVNDAHQVVERALAFRPRLVILDIGLPGLSGHEIARTLRATPELAGALLVALTGHGRDEDRDLTRAAGFDRHWVKPIGPSELKTLLLDL